ncbi:MAG: aldo/keto reductase [bacterium]|nr:aldo/keto reductase [bacterium]
MQYRQIGTTGLSASIIGMGTEWLDRQPYTQVERTIHAALDAGINIMDLFMPGEEVRRNIGRALKGRRDQVMLQGHICSVDLNEQYDISRDPAVCTRYFENLLRFLDTDYIDLGMMFFMDSEEALTQVQENGIYEYMCGLKQKGVVRAIGASSHNPPIARKLVEAGMIDVLMFSINAAFDMTGSGTHVLDTLKNDFSGQDYAGVNPERLALYQLCAQRGVGITVMKPLGAGKLLSPEHSPFAQPMTVGQCIHYALTRPAVASVMVGCRSPEQVQDAVAYLNLTEAEKDYTHALQGERSSMQGSCVYCNHCRPCPVNIDIATVHKYLDIARLDSGNIPPSVRRHYQALDAGGADCLACGECEARCPFGVAVAANMEEAAQLLG